MSFRKNSKYFYMLKNRKKKEEESQKKEETKNKSISCFFSLPNSQENGKRKRDIEEKLAKFEVKRPKITEEIPTKETKCSKKEENKKKKLTPLEQQVKELKDKHSDILLMVECGYRFRFFGQDAEKAAKILDISAHEDSVGSGNLGLTASVPTHNGPTNYVRKLVLNGEKVGIVSQTESAAQKKANSQSCSGTFARDLTQVYTASTFLEDLYDEKNRIFTIMAISKDSCLAFTPISGVLTLTKSNVKDALTCIEPFEIVSPEKSEVIDDYIHDQRLFRNNPVRMEILKNPEKIEMEATLEKADKSIRQIWPSLGKNDIEAFQILLHYLEQFSMESLLFQAHFELGNSFISDSVMKLPQMTIDGLDLPLLLKLINLAKTKPGKRLFKTWLYNPITVQFELEQRLDSVEFLVENPAFLKQLKAVTGKNPFDFEVNLMCAINQKITQDRFQLCMKTLASIPEHFKSVLVLEEVKLPSLLDKIMSEICEIFSTIPLDLMTTPLKKTEKYEKLQEEITDFEQQLQDHKKEICKRLGLLQFQYSTVSGLDYLIEVRNGVSVPSNWSKISATQKLARYRSPLILQLLPKIQWSKEQLQQEEVKAWKQFLQEKVPDLKLILKTLKTWAALDVILALASLASRDGFCRPKFNQNGNFKAENSRNLIIEDSLLSKPGCQFVANDVSLESGQALVLTGPNMGGKSCYLRQVGILSILAQMGSFVPCAKCSIPIFDALYIRIGARDEIERGKSTLFMELEETSLILKNATQKSLVLIDELGRGTATFDGTAIAKSALKYLVESVKCLTLFVTHFKSLQDSDQIKSAHMGFMKDESDVLFLYKLTEGKAQSSFGLNVAKMAEIPESVISRANVISKFYEVLSQNIYSE